MKRSLFQEFPVRTLTLLFLLALAVTPLRAQSDEFYVSKNMFTPGVDTVDIQVALSHYPNNLFLRIYNSAGEVVKILDQAPTSGPFYQTYSWDGTNVKGEKVASGLYLIFLKADQYAKTARILAVQ